MKKNSTLSRKLAAYAAMAAAGVASFGTAGAQIVYTDIPDVNFAQGDTFNLDFNADAIADYTLKHRFFSSVTSTSSSIVINRQMLCEPAVVGNMAMASSATAWAAWNWYGQALNLNAPINAAATWRAPGGVDVRSCVWFASTYQGNLYGNFADATDHYLGAKFNISGSMHYGWMRVNIGLNCSSMVLKDFAYETQADVEILAGQMVSVGVAEATLTDVKVFSTSKKIIVDAPHIGGTINVFNNMGQLIRSNSIDDTRTVLNMLDVDAGIYLVQVQVGDNAITQRVILK